MPVTKTILDQGKRVKIAVSEQFDERHFGAFHDAFSETADTCETYEVDLSGVTQMISAGLGILILMRENARAINASLKIINPSIPAKRILEMAFLHKMLDICFEPANH